ncbi:myb/SANT-like DNA-binding domain-containing protein 4 [Centruroides vittatus]|uniref:myb/SANT-like DNA-binding domain-containing protein 4 n=1 Tax=Centruroides vittatus TaxID=120091 RepID=UPI003510BF0B
MQAQLQRDRKRKANFTKDEVDTLIEEVKRNKSLLFSKINNATTKDVKKNIWAGIACRVNTLNSSADRTASEVKKKWQDLQTATRRKEILRRRVVKDGDGTPPPNFTPVEAKVANILNDTAIEAGVASWVVSLSPDAVLYQSSEASALSGEGDNSLLSAPGSSANVTDEPQESTNRTFQPPVFSMADNVLGIDRIPTTKPFFIPPERNFIQQIPFPMNDISFRMIEIESQRLEVEKQRLEIEKQRLEVERRRLEIEEERLRIEIRRTLRERSESV